MAYLLARTFPSSRAATLTTHPSCPPNEATCPPPPFLIPPCEDVAWCEARTSKTLSRRSSEPVIRRPVEVKVSARMVVAWAAGRCQVEKAERMSSRTRESLDELMGFRVEERDLAGVRSVREQSPVRALSETRLKDTAAAKTPTRNARMRWTCRTILCPPCARVRCRRKDQTMRQGRRRRTPLLSSQVPGSRISDGAPW